MERVLRDLGCHDRELSILFTDNQGIAELNRRYLGREGPTNVLAFPMTGGPEPEIDSPMLGDVVISVDRASQESEELEEPLGQTIDRLLIHGVLHLLGYDHEKSTADAGRMEEEEKRLMKLIGD